MSLVDTTFGPIPGPLIQQWGLDATFVASGGPGTYDPATGNIADTTTRTPVKVVITKINPEEVQGLYQATPKWSTRSPSAATTRCCSPA